MADSYKPCRLEPILCSISGSIAASKYMFMQQSLVPYNGIIIPRYQGASPVSTKFSFYFNAFINIIIIIIVNIQGWVI
jgi:hypothetical protein